MPVRPGTSLSPFHLGWLIPLAAGPLASATAQPLAVEPDVALADARAAYRAGPVADRVAVSVRRGSQILRRDIFTVRLSAGSPDSRDDDAVRIELGRLRIGLSGTTLVIERAAGDGPCLVHTLDQPPTSTALVSILRPLPIPQLDLAFGTADAGLTPLAASIVWTSATLEPDARPATVTLRGRGDGGPVELTLFAATGRLQRLTLQLEPADADPPLTLELLSTPLPDAGDPSTWRIDTTGREQVHDLTELFRQERPVAPGAPVGELLLFDLELNAWSLTQAQAAADRKTPPPVVLILFRADAAAQATSVFDDALSGARALTRLAATTTPPAADPSDMPFLAVAAAVFELNAFRRDRLVQLQHAWNEQLDQTAGLAVPLLWSVHPGQTIDRFAQDASAALVVVDADGRCRGVVHLDQAADRLDELTAQLATLLRPTPVLQREPENR